MSPRRPSVLNPGLPDWRRRLVLGGLMTGFAVISAYAFYLQGINKSYLQGKGNAVAERHLTLPAPRGQITDRHGNLLAHSSPEETLWVRPTDLVLTESQRNQLAGIIGMPRAELDRRLASRKRGEFNLKRLLTPDEAAKVAALGAPGLILRREFRRHYPQGALTAHIVGFTNIDDVGQEGVERAYDDWLTGKAGERRILRDPRGHIVRDLMPVRAAKMGGALALSLDLNLQHIAYRELNAAVERHRASGGSVVVLDARTGEVLALVNSPGFNPNNRQNFRPGPMRNRAVIDIFEPGSTIKPFVAAMAIEKGIVTPDTVIDTTNNYRVGSHLVRDRHPRPQLTVTEILQRSNNVGSVKLALALPPQDYWSVLDRVGFGHKPGSGFPGEAAGRLRPASTWRPVEHATMSYGYGLSVSLLQLARAYTAFANDGEVVPVSFVKREPQEIVGERIFSPEVARTVRAMMVEVTNEGGTGTLTRIPGYRVAGKTGTAEKLIDGRYAPDRFLSSFVGMAPASSPRLIVGVVIDDPRGGEHYGGRVAGPVFREIMAASLRALGLPPDDPASATRVTLGEPAARGGA